MPVRIKPTVRITSQGIVETNSDIVIDKDSTSVGGAVVSTR